MPTVRFPAAERPAAPSTRATTPNQLTMTIRFLTLLALAVSPAAAQQAGAPQVSQPVYRVANEAAATPTQSQAPAQTPAKKVDPAVQPVAGVAGSPFDLVERPNEHPLATFIRMGKQSLELIDTNYRDYTAVLTKQERVDGTLNEQQQIAVKIRHQPFGVHMKFIKPLAGQEVLYPSTQKPGKLIARAAGWKSTFGKIPLDPDGAMAMEGQRYPITRAGIRNLIAELVKISEAETKFAECEVRYSTSAKIDGRPTTMVEIKHPVPRSSFKSHIARVFFDNELRIPVGYQAYSWPTSPGGKPVLEKQYFYTQLRLNAGLTDADFDETNPNLFQ